MMMNTNDKPATRKHLSRAAATVAATLLLAAPLGASAQTNTAPSQDQINAIRSLTDKAFNYVHDGKADDFAAITTSDFKVTLPDGSTTGVEGVFAPATARDLASAGYSRDVTVNSITADGTSVTEDVTVRTTSGQYAIDGDDGTGPVQTTQERTLTWVQGADGNWLLSSEKLS
jgi:hypothetical protein